LAADSSSTVRNLVILGHDELPVSSCHPKTPVAASNSSLHDRKDEDGDDEWNGG